MNNEDLVATQEQVRQRVKSWLVAFNTKDRDALFALFHPDMIYANDGVPLMRGAKQIHPWYDQAFKMLDGRALFREEAIVIEGNSALVVGTFYFEPGNADTPESEAGSAGRVAMVWRRTADGPWLLCFDMDNRPPDALPENFSGAGQDAYLAPQEVN